MNTTVTVQVDNLPAVQQELAKARAEIERLTAQLAESNTLRGPYRVGELWPSDDRIVVALCEDGEYRTVRHGDDGRWYHSDTPWQADGNEEPIYWWELLEVAKNIKQCSP